MEFVKYSRPPFGNAPPAILMGLEAYFVEFRPPGEFLRAVLENNLMEAFNRADTWSASAMADIAAAIYNEAPAYIPNPPPMASPADVLTKPHGDPGNVRRWLQIPHIAPTWAAGWTAGWRIKLAALKGHNDAS